MMEKAALHKKSYCFVPAKKKNRIKIFTNLFFFYKYTSIQYIDYDLIEIN